VLYVESPVTEVVAVSVLPTEAVPPMLKLVIDRVETRGEEVDAEYTVTLVTAPPTVTPLAPVTATKK
jgi:hypothetical protein